MSGVSLKKSLFLLLLSVMTTFVGCSEEEQKIRESINENSSVETNRTMATEELESSIEEVPREDIQSSLEVEENNQTQEPKENIQNSLEGEENNQSQESKENTQNSLEVEESLQVQLPTENIEDYTNSSILLEPKEENDSNETDETTQKQEPINYAEVYINESNCSQVVDKEFFKICYDKNLKVAKSVAYTLYGDLVNEVNIEDRPTFYSEESIEEEYRAKYSDYTHSGYDRGHLAPDAAFDWSQESLESTYSLANIIPQAPNVNRYMWIKAEKYARDKAVELGEVQIINIIKYDSNTSHIGESNITVSLGYYKMLWEEDSEYRECFFYKNDLNTSSEDDTLEAHRVDCGEV